MKKTRKNTYGADIMVARFPRCKRCRYFHESKTCTVRIRRRTSLLLALHRNNEELEKSLNEVFKS